MITSRWVAVAVTCLAVLVIIVALQPISMTSREITPSHFLVGWGTLGHRYHYEAVKPRQFEAVEYVSESRMWDGFCFGESRGKIIRFSQRLEVGYITTKVEQSVQAPAFGFIPVCSWRGFEPIASWEGWRHLEGVPDRAARIINEGRQHRAKARRSHSSGVSA